MISIEKKQVTSVATKTTVYISSYSNMEITGILYNEHINKRLNFTGVCDFIFKMQTIFDELAFPQSTFKLRSFKNKNKIEIMNEIGKVINMNEKDKIIDINDNNLICNEAKFIINVKCRQNATWQGTIKWLDNNEEKQFRSALEMLKLMDEALSESSENKKLKWK